MNSEEQRKSELLVSAYENLIKNIIELSGLEYDEFHSPNYRILELKLNVIARRKDLIGK